MRLWSVCAPDCSRYCSPPIPGNAAAKIRPHLEPGRYRANPWELLLPLGDPLVTYVTVTPPALRILQRIQRPAAAPVLEMPRVIACHAGRIHQHDLAGDWLVSGAG